MYIFLNYTKVSMRTATLLITIIIYVFLSYTMENISNAYSAIKENIKIVEEKSTFIEENPLEKVEVKEEVSREINEEIFEGILLWQLEIPKISLIGEISEGTAMEVMDEYIGHFENTNRINGNVGLAAHNRGFPVNYFQDLKTLEMGDEIIYRYDQTTRSYSVNVIEIIEDTDWSYLGYTEDNRITLITCVEGKPNLRRVVQGFEIKE